MVHLRFDDDNDAEMVAAEAAPAVDVGLSVCRQPMPPTSPSVSCSVRIDYNLKDPCYVFKAVYEPSLAAVAASASDGTIRIYAVSPAGGAAAVTHLHNLIGHQDRISDVGFLLGSTGGNNSLLHSVSRDGTVRGWDIRTGQEVERFTAHNEELFSMSVLDTALAAGGAGQVLFWDRRKPGKQLSVLGDTHMDDVTQVKLHDGHKVISASADGLIAVHDVNASFEDDDSFQAALNLSNSIEELGLYGPGGNKLWCRTGTESLHLWHWRAAASEEMAGGDGPAAEWIDARGMAAAAATSSGDAAAAELLSQVDYLIGCHYDHPTDRLMLVAGGNNGVAAFFPLDECPATSSQDNNGMAGTSGVMGPPTVLLSGGHSSIVRSVQCFGSGSGNEPFCLTGGEDALICFWGMGRGASGSGAAARVAGTGPVQPERRHDKHHRRVSPY